MIHKVLHLVFKIVQLPAGVNWTTGQTSHPYFGFLLEHVSWLKWIFDSIVIVKNVSRSVAQQLHDSLTNTEPKVKHPRCVFYIFQLHMSLVQNQIAFTDVCTSGFAMRLSSRWTFSEHTGVDRPKRNNVIQPERSRKKQQHQSNIRNDHMWPQDAFVYCFTISNGK